MGFLACGTNFIKCGQLIPLCKTVRHLFHKLKERQNMLKFISRRKLLCAVIFSTFAFGSQVSNAQELQAGNYGKHPLIYSTDEMFQFDIEGFLQAKAPHLLPHAEVISHWAGYSSISPKVLLALMEQQSGALSKPQALAASRPFADLSRETSFAGQVKDVAHQLATMLYAQSQASGAAEFGAKNNTSPLHSLFAARGNQLSVANGVGDFAQTYARLFGKSFDVNALEKAPALSDAQQAGLARMAGPANGFLQFPFPVGSSWHVGGAHTNTGSGNYPMSSLDMSQGGGWGSNQSNVWVTSSAAGTFKRHSSCFAEIVHSSGWSTTYYHLMNIQYNTGASISKNVRFANPANTMGQALCNGGHSTGPHQHWSLKQNGAWYHLNGVYLSGWQITATGSSYDTNCSRFYLTRNGTKRCSGYFTNN